MQDLPTLPHEKIILSNGLQLILHIDRKLPIVHVNEWFHVGSKNEKPGRTGFAHLFEHIMFQGSKNAPKDYFSFVERAGANLREGGVNGTTDFDRTNYFATVPSGNLEFLLWLESDRVSTLAEALTQENLDNQREVVRNERRQSVENVPYGRAFLLITEELYPAGHPYSWDVIGSHEDLIAASLDDVKDFFQRYYTPNNLSLTIAGDFDPSEAKRLVDRYYGDIPPGPPLERTARWVPFLSGEKILEVRDRVPQERSYLVWPALPYFERGDAALDVASRILSDGLSSRLRKALVYDQQLCSDVTAFNQSLEIAGLFGVVATARPGEKLEAIEKGIGDILSRFAEEGPTVEELRRALTKWEFGFVSGLERIGGFGGKADILNRYNTFLGNPEKLEIDMSRYGDLTVEAVRDALRDTFDPKRRLVMRFRPETASAGVSEAVDRSAMPSLGVDRPFVAPTVEQARLDNGLEIFVVTRRELPKVAVAIATRAGSVADPPGKEGLAQMTVKTIDMGTGELDALTLEQRFADLGVSLSGMAGREYATLGFESLRRNFDDAFALFARVIKEPTFNQADVAREVALHLDALSQQSNDPGSLASRIRPMIAFGHTHPYGRPASGLPASISPLTDDDVRSFHREHWSVRHAALIFVGDIDVPAARRLAAEHFGSSTGQAPAAWVIPSPSPMGERTIYLVDRPGSAQTIMTQILPGTRRTSEDYHAFRLADAVWGGGGFGTRLNLNLREEKGYSYGIFSNIAAFSREGAWWASGGIQTDKTSEGLVEFVRELDDLAGPRPITAAELEAAKATRTRGHAQQFESISSIAGHLAELWIAGLPASELQREYEAAASMTLEAVLAAARRFARPERVSYLLVGDRSRIEKGIRELGIGEIVILDEEGRPAKRG